jgi:uncharacterized protein
MMKIDLSRLKLYPRESEAFYLKSNWDDSFLAEVGGKFLAPVELEIEVENTGRMFIGRGNVRTRLQLPCSRCLRDFSCSVDDEIEIAMLESSHDHHVSADEEMLFLDDGKVDISSRIEETIFMAVPISPLCREECQGLCPICGQDKNTSGCFCEKDTIDPRWDKLKSLI